MLILNCSTTADNGHLINTAIKNPIVKNVICNLDNGAIRVLFRDKFREEYLGEYQTNKICDFTSEEMCSFTFRIFEVFDEGSEGNESLDFDNFINNLIDSILDNREEEYDPDDDDRTK